MVKLGWLADYWRPQGGAEMTEIAWRRACPPDVQIEYCPPTRRPPDDVDAFYVGNCAQYDRRWIGELLKKPFVKMVHDPWWHGSPSFRRFVLDNAQMLLFHSPVQVATFSYPLPDVPFEFVPDAVDVDKFREAAQPRSQRKGNVYLGRVSTHKGAHLAMDWAIRSGRELDMYGVWGMDCAPPAEIHYHGAVDHSQVPAILGRAERFVFMPVWTEAFGRATLEAIIAGCEMVIDGNIGCLWWLDHRPDDLGRSAEIFWATMERAIG